MGVRMDKARRKLEKELRELGAKFVELVDCPTGVKIVIKGQYIGTVNTNRSAVKAHIVTGRLLTHITARMKELDRAEHHV